MRALRKGELIVLFNERQYALGQANPDEKALKALIDGKPVGYVLWAVHEPPAGPCPWIETTYAFLYSAWVDPEWRGRGVFSHLMLELRRRTKGHAIRTLTADPAVEHLTDD